MGPTDYYKRKEEGLYCEEQEGPSLKTERISESENSAQEGGGRMDPRHRDACNLQYDEGI